MTVPRESIIDVTQLWTQRYPARECNRISTWATLAVDIYLSSSDYEDQHARHLFVTSISRVFGTMRLRIAAGRRVLEADETVDAPRRLLECMVDSLRWSIRNLRHNCGAYTPPSWVKDIAQCYTTAQESQNGGYDNPLREIPLTGNETIRPLFFLVLDLLQTCLDRNLLSGTNAVEDFQSLRELVGAPELLQSHAEMMVGTLPARQAADLIHGTSQVRHCVICVLWGVC